MLLIKSLQFVEVHQALLNILIGKAGLVPNLLPFVGPTVAQVLRQVESVVDVSSSRHTLPQGTL